MTVSALLGVVACTSGTEQQPRAAPRETADMTSSVASTTGAPSTTSTSTEGTTTTSTTPAETLAIMTETGIPVAVLENSDAQGFVVMTPCGFEAEIATGEPLGITDVVIDPGHGGPTDTGAVGANGLSEKEVNLEVARLIVEMLGGRGIPAVLTRSGDYASPLFVRAHLADTVGARLMVSIHHNAPTPAPSPDPGVEVFVQKGSEDSARLGGLLWEQTRSALSAFDVPWTGAEDSGVMTVLNSRGDDAYGIIRHPETTTALVELGYISNPAEAELFATSEYPPVAARAVVDAIEAFLTTEDPGSGFVEGRSFNPRPGIGQDVCVDPDLG